MDGLVFAAHRAPGPTHIGLSCAWQSAEPPGETVHLNRSGSISLLPPLAKGNFRGRRLRAFWRNAPHRADLRRCGQPDAAGAARAVPRRDRTVVLQSLPCAIGSKASWTVATVARVTMLMALAAAWNAAVVLKDIAAEVDGLRSIPALARALAWLGSG